MSDKVISFSNHGRNNLKYLQWNITLPERIFGYPRDMLG